MPQSSVARVVVIGGGAFGMACALSLAERGLAPIVVDPSPETNASAIAAGMISPALEAALEGADVERAALYRAAAEIWPSFSATHRLDLRQDGADWVGPQDTMADQLSRLGFEAFAWGAGLRIPGEARIDAPAALAKMGDRVRTGGGELIRARVSAVRRQGRGVRLDAGDWSIDASHVVLAAGWEAGALELDGASALHALIRPIRGQLQRLQGAGTEAITRIRRNASAYLAPTSGGLVVGATMEPGRTDSELDPTVAETLRLRAIEMAPELAGCRLAGGAVGIRGASPDGLPLIGALDEDGRVFAALGPRRNGWLLAPLAGEIIAALITGAEAPRQAEAFRPDRFDPA